MKRISIRSLSIFIAFLLSLSLLSVSAAVNYEISNMYENVHIIPDDEWYWDLESNYETAQSNFEGMFASFSITWHANGGSPTRIWHNVPAGAQLGPPPPPPTRQGFTFGGWFTVQIPIGGVQVLPSTQMPHGNVMVFARWTSNLIFNPNGGNPINPPNRLVPVGLSFMSVGPIPIPTRSGRAFIGWFTTSANTGGIRLLPHTVPNGNTTLFARWTDPNRHLGRWWPAASPNITNIPFRVVAPRGITGNWVTYMNNGINNWNRYSTNTRVNFQSNSSSNNTATVENSIPGWIDAFGVFFTRQSSGTSVNRFDIVLHAPNITTHASSIGGTVNNVATSVMAHELGHAAGLSDNPSGGGNSSLMSHARNRNNVTSPSAFDRTSVSMLYN